MMWEAMAREERLVERTVDLHANDTRFAWAAVVFLIGIMVTTAGLIIGLKISTEASNAEFSRLSDRVAREVDRRLHLAAYGLGGARGAVATLGRVPNASEYRDYVDSRDLPREFSGVTGFGLIVKVPRADLAAFEQAASQDYNGAFEVKQAGQEGDLYVIRSIEPLARNREALGLNLAFETNRRQALERLYRDGLSTATGPIRLVQDGESRPGALYLVPVFGSGRPERQGDSDPVIAVVYAALTYEVLLTGVLPDSKRATEFLLRDVEADPSQGLLFDSNPGGNYRPVHASSRDIPFGGRTLRLEQTSSAAFDDEHQPWMVWLAAALAYAFSLSLAALVLQLISTRQRAEQLAQSMTGDLRRLTLVAEKAQQGVLFLDKNGRVEWANDMFLACSHFDEESLRGKRFVDQVVTVDTELETVRTLRAALSLKDGWVGSICIRAADGAPCWANIDVSPVEASSNDSAAFVVLLAKSG